jgi:hypothetical protein
VDILARAWRDLIIAEVSHPRLRFVSGRYRADQPRVRRTLLGAVPFTVPRFANVSIALTAMSPDDLRKISHASDEDIVKMGVDRSWDSRHGHDASRRLSRKAR